MTSLPILSLVSSLYPNADFSDVLLVASQHILGTTLSMFQELFRKGLRPSNTFLIGKCYSTNFATLLHLRSLGVIVSERSCAFSSYAAFDDQFEQFIDEFGRCPLRTSRTGPFRRVIVLDDGGALLRWFARAERSTNQFVGVEQTSSGFHMLKALSLPFPVINVARSPAKLTLEPPVVAATIGKRINEYVRTHQLMTRKVLVVGQGPIGAAISRYLDSYYDVNRFDISANPGHIWPGSAEPLNRFEMIVGATGRSVLGPALYSKLRLGTVLVSASSPRGASGDNLPIWECSNGCVNCGLAS